MPSRTASPLADGGGSSAVAVTCKLGQHYCPITNLPNFDLAHKAGLAGSVVSPEICIFVVPEDRNKQNLAARDLVPRGLSGLARQAGSGLLAAMNFASDNTAGIAPGILDAIGKASGGFALGYGNDDLTRAVERQFGELFERDVAVFLVPTGTAANALGLAHITPPWRGVLCHAASHIVTDECGAPEFFGGGLKLLELPGDNCKLAPETVKAAIARYSGHVPHQVNAGALSLTQATEGGTIYRVDEVAMLASLAHEHGLAVHMDGARFANALARMNVSPADATWKAGVDVLSFGATKGGAMAAEAVVFFDPKRADAMAERRKRGGHLLSKHRYLAAQFAAFLSENYWLALARHANAMADKLAEGLRKAGLQIVWPVEANLVFVLLPEQLDRKLKAAGASYYVRRADMLAGNKNAATDNLLARLVTSFATTEHDVQNFIRVIQNG